MPRYIHGVGRDDGSRRGEKEDRPYDQEDNRSWLSKKVDIEFIVEETLRKDRSGSRKHGEDIWRSTFS